MFSTRNIFNPKKPPQKFYKKSYKQGGLNPVIYNETNYRELLNKSHSYNKDSGYPVIIIRMLVTANMTLAFGQSGSPSIGNTIPTHEQLTSEDYCYYAGDLYFLKIDSDYQIFKINHKSSGFQSDFESMKIPLKLLFKLDFPFFDRMTLEEMFVRDIKVSKRRLREEIGKLPEYSTSPSHITERPSKTRKTSPSLISTTYNHPEFSLGNSIITKKIIPQTKINRSLINMQTNSNTLFVSNSMFAPILPLLNNTSVDLKRKAGDISPKA